MNHQAHVGLVNSHAESIGTHHYTNLVLLPSLLFFRPFLSRQSCVIKVCRNAILLQKHSIFACFLTVAHIKYARPRHFVEYRKQFANLVLGVYHIVNQVFALETFLEDIVDRKFQSVLNVVNHFGSCCCSKCKHWHIGQDFADFSNFEVGRTEIVAPLRNAMRLVNGYQVDVHNLEPFAEIVVFESLGRKVEELVVAVGCIINGNFYFVLSHSRINCDSFYSAFLQICDLVFHQCD